MIFFDQNPAKIKIIIFSLFSLMRDEKLCLEEVPLTLFNIPIFTEYGGGHS